MEEIIKKYTNGEVTIVWKPSHCIHSTICWKGTAGLLSVFNPSKKPWIDPLGSSTDKIITQVNKCPSGALSYYMNSDPAPQQKTEPSVTNIIEVTPNGPLMVHGDITLR